MAKRVCPSDLSSQFPPPSSNCVKGKRVCSSDLSLRWPSPASTSSANWSWLPTDVLDLIIDKLAVLCDIIRFGAVCKSWNSVALDQKDKLKRLIIDPWQLVINSDPNHKPLQLFNFTNSEFCKFHLHNPFDKPKLCHGSCHGWLVFEKKCFQLIVLNPFTGKIIDLPPIRINSRFAELGKVVLSRDPYLGSFEVLVNFYSPFRMEVLAHLKFGDEFWTYSEEGHDKELGTFNDITFYDKWIFGASSKGRIVSLEIDHDIGCIKFNKEIIPKLSWKISLCPYFVQTANGDLLIVYDFDKSYNVYKLKHSNGEFKSIQVKQLGDQALFVGINHCTLVLASNYSRYEANTICCSYATMG